MHGRGIYYIITLLYIFTLMRNFSIMQGLIFTMTKKPVRKCGSVRVVTSDRRRHRLLVFKLAQTTQRVLLAGRCVKQNTRMRQQTTTTSTATTTTKPGGTTTSNYATR